MKFDIEEIALPDTLLNQVKTAAEERAAIAPAAGAEPPRSQTGTSFYDQILDTGGEVYKLNTNTPSTVLILPSCFPFTKAAEEKAIQAGMDIFPLTEVQRSVLSDTQSVHSRSPKGGKSLVDGGYEYIPSPLLVIDSFGTSGERGEFELSKPICSPSTARRYPGLWPEVEAWRNVIDVYRTTILFDQEYNGMPWGKDLFSKPDVNAFMPRAFAIMYVLPLVEKDKLGTVPQIWFGKLPVGKNAWNAPGKGPLAHVRDAYIKAVTEMQPTAITSNPANPVVLSMTKNQPNGLTGMDRQKQTTYTGVNLHSLGSPFVTKALTALGYASSRVTEILQENLLSWIAANPLHSKIKFATEEEQLDTLNKAVFKKGYRVAMEDGLSGELVLRTVPLATTSLPQETHQPAKAVSTPAVAPSDAGRKLLLPKDLEAYPFGHVLNSIYKSTVHPNTQRDGLYLSVVESGLERCPPELQEAYEDTVTAYIVSETPGDLDNDPELRGSVEDMRAYLGGVLEEMQSIPLS